MLVAGSYNFIIQLYVYAGDTELCIRKKGNVTTVKIYTEIIQHTILDLVLKGRHTLFKGPLGVNRKVSMP